MQIETLNSLFQTHKEASLFGRYIHTDHIEPLLHKLDSKFKIETIGASVNNEEIYSITIGNGATKVLMWSQMHGNESTTTKALFDLCNLLSSDECDFQSVLNDCTLKIIPILNPDGARAYTRFNANEIDLNRDAQDLTQPESIALRAAFNAFKPDFCFNLHGQRTIFSAGKNNFPATLSFLAPAQDVECTLTTNRKIAMEVINAVNFELQKLIPNQIGIYDDAFNLNCVGDTFQSLKVPTLLFEAGHFANDYSREQVRILIFESMRLALLAISKDKLDGSNYLPYLSIPKNEKCFFDIIIRAVKVKKNNDVLVDVAVQYQEILIDNKIEFSPIIEKIGDLNAFYGHKEFNAHGNWIQIESSKQLKEGFAIDFVMINNERLSLKLIKS